MATRKPQHQDKEKRAKNVPVSQEKARLIKILVTGSAAMFENLVEVLNEGREEYHGGWDECEGDEAEALVGLTEQEAALATIEGWRKSLEKPSKYLIEQVIEHNRPYKDYAERAAEEKEDEEDE